MRRLKNVLLINAVSSGLSGLLLIIFPGKIAGLFGTSETLPFLVIGIALLPFAGGVYMVSRKEPLLPEKVNGIIWMDLSWVIGSLIIILFQLFGLGFTGYLLIGVMAAWVATMAALQWSGLKRLSN